MSAFFERSEETEMNLICVAKAVCLCHNETTEAPNDHFDQ